MLERDRFVVELLRGRGLRASGGPGGRGSLPLVVALAGGYWRRRLALQPALLAWLASDGGLGAEPPPDDEV